MGNTMSKVPFFKDSGCCLTILDYSLVCWERYCHFVTTELPFQQTLKQCIIKRKWIQVMLALRFHWLDDKIWWETWYISDVGEHLWRKDSPFRASFAVKRTASDVGRKFDEAAAKRVYMYFYKDDLLKLRQSYC